MCGGRWNLFSDEEKGRFYGNLAAAMYGIPDFVLERQVKHFGSVDPAYEAGVRKALAGMDEEHEQHKTEKDMDRMAMVEPNTNTEEVAPAFDHAK